jgi:hypothetical protein
VDKTIVSQSYPDTDGEERSARASEAHRRHPFRGDHVTVARILPHAQLDGRDMRALQTTYAKIGCT